MSPDPFEAVHRAVAKGALRQAEELVRELPELSPTDEVRRLLLLAELHRWLGRRSSAGARALAAAEALGDRVLAAEALVQRASDQLEDRHPERATHLAGRALELGGSSTGLRGRALRLQALAAAQRGAEEAHELRERAVQALRADGDVLAMAGTLIERADAQVRRGVLDAASSTLREVRALPLPPHVRARALRVGARLAATRGDLAGAEALARDAVARLAELELQGESFDAVSDLGEVLRLQGRRDEALAHVRAALALAPTRSSRVFPLCNLGLLAVAGGALEEGAARFSEALSCATWPLPAWLVALGNLGQLAAASARGDEATWWVCWDRGVAALSDTVGIDRDAAMVLTAAGRAAVAAGFGEGATRAWCRVLDLGVDGEGTTEARQELEDLAAAGASARLGPYQLQELIGSGGMGSVWRARSPHSGRDVAVKVIRGGHEDAAALLTEARLARELSHPGVVSVLDVGVVGAGADCMTAGRVVSGSPWVAMELLEGRTLQGLGGALGWTRIRAILLDVLAALGHAHARGILHLDVKPANVLTSGDRVALVDFGLGRKFTEQSSTRVAGTPAYMAPEQLRGGGRAVGPWTDLYALGCLATELAQGAPPFGTRNIGAVRRGHLTQPPPPLQPRMPVPVGLEAWISALLRKQPLARCAVARDAAAALLALGPPDPSTVGGSTVPVATEAHTLDDWALPPEPTEEAPHPMPGGIPPAPTPTLAPPCAAREPAHSLPAEREELWAAVATPRSGPRLVGLRAEPGSGRAALASWLLRVASEHGGVITLRMRESSQELLGVLLQARGLGADALRIHLRRHCAPWQPTEAALEGLQRALGGDGADAAICSVIDRLRRPVVVGLAELGAAQLAWLECAARAGTDALVVCPREAALVEPQDASRRWSRAASLLPTSCIEIARPASERLRETLVERGASIGLAQQVVRATGGRPAEAVALLEHADQRGIATRSPSGLALRPGAELPVRPPDAAWTSLAEACSVALEGPWVRALVLRAMLSRRTRSDWLVACAAAGVDGARAEEVLRGRGLLAEGAELPAVELGAALCAWSEQAELAQELHAACAAAAPDDPEHLLGAGRPLEALPLLRAASSRALERGWYARALAYAERWERTIVSEPIAAGDREWVEGWLCQARARLHCLEWKGAADQARLVVDRAPRERAEGLMLQAHCAIALGRAEGEGLLERAQAEAARAGDAPLEARAAWLHAAFHYAEGDGDRAAALLEGAAARLRAVGQPARALLALGMRAHAGGALEEAEQLLEEGVEVAREAGDPFRAALCLNVLASTLLVARGPEAARGCRARRDALHPGLVRSIGVRLSDCVTELVAGDRDPWERTRAQLGGGPFLTTAPRPALVSFRCVRLAADVGTASDAQHTADLEVVRDMLSAGRSVPDLLLLLRLAEDLAGAAGRHDRIEGLRAAAACARWPPPGPPGGA